VTEVPLTIKDAAAALPSGAVTSADLTAALLERIERLNPSLGAFIAVTSDSAQAAARQADADLRQGVDKGPLHGIPLGVKDIIATSDAPTTANSHILYPEWGAGWDAPDHVRIRAAVRLVGICGVRGRLRLAPRCQLQAWASRPRRLGLTAHCQRAARERRFRSKLYASSRSWLRGCRAGSSDLCVDHQCRFVTAF
jgi:hypothetical protein